MKYTFLLFILFISATSLHGSEQLMLNLLPSTEWQKVQLEKEINYKLVNVLSPIVDKKKMIIDIEISLSENSKPKFQKTLEDEKKEAQQKANIEKNKRKGIVRINDNLPDKLPEDYIIFSKLGLEAPLIEDVLANELKKAQLPKDPNKENINKKPGTQELPTLEQTWNYNSSLDIFKNLEEVKVTIKIDNSLQAIHETNIKNLIENAKLSYGEITPEITIKYIPLINELFPNGTKSYLEYTSKFGNGIGIILSVLLLGFFSLILFKKYEKLKREEMENNNQSAAPAAVEKAEEKDQKDDKNNNPELPLPGMDSESTEFLGIKRFHNYLENSEELAIMLIRRWINADEPSEKMALKALVQQLENIDLEKIFLLLNKKMKTKWRENLDGPLSVQQLIQANQFISNQIIEDIIIPNIVKDPELQELLLSITPEAGQKLIEEDIEFGKILMYLLQSNILSEIFNLTDVSTVDLIIKDSLHFNDKELQVHLSRFKNSLKGFSSSGDDGEMISKIIELIPNSSKEQEQLLYSNIASIVDHDRFVQLAFKNYPSELVDSLSNNIIKNVFANYSMNTKVETLMSFDESMLEWNLDILAPVGSKAKDLFDLEFEKNKDDLDFQRRLKTSKNEIWNNHIKSIRELLSQNKQFQPEIQEIITEWSNQKYELDKAHTEAA